MYKNLVLAALVAALALSIALGVLAQGSTSTIEVRVWERISDPEQNYISARPAGGSWSTLGTIPLEMKGESRSGTFRFGDITLAVPLPWDGLDLGPSSPWAQRVDITCTFHRQLRRDTSDPNRGWKVEGTFSHRLPFTFPVNIGVQPQRPAEVPEDILYSQLWDEKLVPTLPIDEEVPPDAEVAWNVSMGGGPFGPGNDYADFSKVYVVSFYDRTYLRVALDPPIECPQTADRYY